MAQRSKAQVSGTFRQVGKYRQGVGVDGKLLVKRVFQRCKDMEAVIIRVYGEGKDVFDQRCVIMPGRTLEFDVCAKTQGFGHEGIFLMLFLIT